MNNTETQNWKDSTHEINHKNKVMNDQSMFVLEEALIVVLD